MFDNPIWLLVLASIIAAIGITIVYKQSLAFVTAELDRSANADIASLLKKQQSAFFVKVALVEAIPMILVFVGMLLFFQVSEAYTVMELLVPLLIIVGAPIVGVVNLYIATTQTLSHPVISNQPIGSGIRAFAFLACALMASIPMISIVLVIVIILS